ncbi:MAG: ABC transporter permease [Gammaproteobacteria bacterium]|nr:ABC transporter permease [Gammaproteobacteria bacterium]
MAGYIVRRLVSGLITVLIVTILLAFLINIIPGDPVRMLFAMSQTTSAEQIEEIRHDLGLDLPWYKQYVKYVGEIVRGDWGETIRGQQDVFHLLVIRHPNTISLALAALLIALIVGFPLGFFSAYKKGTPVDTISMTAAIVGVSMPHFWLGLMLMQLFAIKLEWLPVAGDGWENIILPALTLGLSQSAIIARLTRSSMIDILGQDFVRTARSKGLREAVVLYRHVLRSGLVTVVAMLGLLFTYMLGGAVVVENVFAWNGVGRFSVEHIMERDYPVIRGFILMFALVVTGVSILMDIVYGWLDPRIKRS